LLVAGVSLIVLASAGRAQAADLSAAMPVKAPRPPAAYDWSGLYLGGILGYAAGSSDWSATQAAAAAPIVTGSLNMFNAYDMFRDTGSELAGLQAGYNKMFPSAWCSASRPTYRSRPLPSGPHLISGIATISSPSLGLASYSEQVQLSARSVAVSATRSATWLVYATGGLAGPTINSPACSSSACRLAARRLPARPRPC